MGRREGVQGLKRLEAGISHLGGNRATSGDRVRAVVGIHCHPVGW